MKRCLQRIRREICVQSVGQGVPTGGQDRHVPCSLCPTTNIRRCCHKLDGIQDISSRCCVAKPAQRSDCIYIPSLILYALLTFVCAAPYHVEGWASVCSTVNERTQFY